jgi:hypothetical protein
MGDRLYEGMNIQGATGLRNVQKATLKGLGALAQSSIPICDRRLAAALHECKSIPWGETLARF